LGTFDYFTGEDFYSVLSLSDECFDNGSTDTTPAACNRNDDHTERFSFVRRIMADEKRLSATNRKQVNVHGLWQLLCFFHSHFGPLPRRVGCEWFTTRQAIITNYAD
jgi:hypothetical protein